MDNLKTRSKTTIFEHEPWLNVESHDVEFPDGTLIPEWLWLDMPDYAIVVAITDDDKFIAFKQVKYAVAGTTYAPVGGYLGNGEDPLEAAKRELSEETGFEADKWTPLGSFVVDANRYAGKAHLFLAQGAKQVGESYEADLEEQNLVLLTREEMLKYLKEGEFKVLAWTAALSMALLHLD